MQAVYIVKQQIDLSVQRVYGDRYLMTLRMPDTLLASLLEISKIFDLYGLGYRY